MKKEITYLGQKLIIDSDGTIDGYYSYWNKNTGYEAIMLKDSNGKARPVYVHRIVALAFCNPPKNWKELQVDHINSIRDDNRAENLRWVTRKKNNSTKLARKRKSEHARHSNRKNQIIKAVDKKTGAVSYFDNARKAALALGCSHVLIHNALNPKYYAKSAKGHLLSYISKEQYEKEMN